MSNQDRRFFAVVGTLFVLVVVALAIPSWFSNWGFIEPTLGLLSIPAIIAIVRSTMPVYTSVCWHDGTSYLGVPSYWTSVRGVATGDLELFVKATSGAVITGRFVTAKDAILYMNPKPVHVKTVWFGKERGRYFTVPVKVLNEEFLGKTGRIETPDFKHEVQESYPPIS